MRSLREYKSPKAEVTVFECEDVITRSSLADGISSGGDLEYGTKKYIKVKNGASWSDIYGGQ